MPKYCGFKCNLLLLFELLRPYQFGHTEEPVQWHHLTELVLNLRYNCPLQSSHLVRNVIQSCSNLQALYLINLESSLEEDFDILEESPLQKLETVFLESISRITVEALHRLVQSDHNLIKVTIRQYRLINSAAIDTIKVLCHKYAPKATLYLTKAGPHD